MSISAIGNTSNWYSSSVYNQNTGTNADSSTISQHHKRQVAEDGDGQSAGMSIMMAMSMMGVGYNPTQVNGTQSDSDSSGLFDKIKSGEISESDISDVITKLKDKLTDLSSKLTDNMSEDDLKKVMDQLGQDMRSVPPMIMGQLLQPDEAANTQTNSDTQTSDLVTNLKTLMEKIITQLGQVSDQDVNDIVTSLKENRGMPPMMGGGTPPMGGGMPPMGGNMSDTMVGGTTSTDSTNEVNNTTSYQEKLAQKLADFLMDAYSSTDDGQDYLSQLSVKA